MGDEIGGHNVSGHVHSTAAVAEVLDTENNRRITFKVHLYHLQAFRTQYSLLCRSGCFVWCEARSRREPQYQLLPELTHSMLCAGAEQVDEIHTAQGICCGGWLQPHGEGARIFRA